MRICSRVPDLRAARDALAGPVGFVPTMGALHEGHATLMRRARDECASVVVSIFVNPTQFNDAADLAKYPRTPEHDEALAAQAGCDVLFRPDVADVYPDGTACDVDPGPAARGFEGAFRPGHFAGVCQVVQRLFALATPDRAYFGRKDAQQLAVIRGIAGAVEIVGCDTVRDPDGLALSSRNRRLSPEAREQALGISAGLFRAQAAFASGERNPDVLAQTARTAGIEYEYCACVDPDTFGPVKDQALIVVAATVGGVRLIDNLLLKNGWSLT